MPEPPGRLVLGSQKTHPPPSTYNQNTPSCALQMIHRQLQIRNTLDTVQVIAMLDSLENTKNSICACFGGHSIFALDAVAPPTCRLEPSVLVLYRSYCPTLAFLSPSSFSSPSSPSRLSSFPSLPSFSLSVSPPLPVPPSAAVIVHDSFVVCFLSKFTV